MSTPTNHWKLGLFVVVGVLIALGVVVYLGAQSLRKETVSFKSYFDEAVTGLEVGAPVKFRGVTIGNVSHVDIAVDRRHVEVTSDLGVSVLTHLGLASALGRNSKISAPEDLRVQLGSTGITGVKYVQMDFFDVTNNPPPKLPFPVPPNYIPAAPSTMKNIEDSIVQALRRFPDLLDELIKMVTRVNGMLDELDRKGLSDLAASTFNSTNQVLSVLQMKLEQVPTDTLSREAQATMANVNGAVTKLQSLMDKVDGDKGLMVSAQRASDSVGDVARNARGVGVALEETLREVRDAAEAIRTLAQMLERDPDMLLKGRAQRAR